RRVEDALIRLRVEHRDHEFDGPTRCEVLPPIATEVRADDLLVGGTLGVDVSAPEVVLRELRDHERERAVRKRDLLVAAENRGVLLLHLLEERDDALSDGLLSFGIELFVDELAVLLEAPSPKAALFIGLPLVMHLGEYEIEELPEGSVLRHALVAVDEVVAAPEGSA